MQENCPECKSNVKRRKLDEKPHWLFYKCGSAACEDGTFKQSEWCRRTADMIKAKNNK